MNERKILVADDEAILRRFTQLRVNEVCERLGIEAKFDSVSTGREAIKMTRANDYCLAVLDNNMECDNAGAGAILEIRKYRPNLPMILYTTQIDDDKALAVRNAGAEIVIKDIVEDELEDVAQRYLGAGK